MGWGITFNIDIYLNKQEYHENIHLVEIRIEDIDEELERIKQNMTMLAASTPKDIYPEENTFYEVQNQVNYCIEELQKLSIQRDHLVKYIEYLQDKENNKKDESIKIRKQ